MYYKFNIFYFATASLSVACVVERTGGVPVCLRQTAGFATDSKVYKNHFILYSHYSPDFFRVLFVCMIICVRILTNSRPYEQKNTSAKLSTT